MAALEIDCAVTVRADMVTSREVARALEAVKTRVSPLLAPIWKVRAVAVPLPLRSRAVLNWVVVAMRSTSA